MPVTVTIVRTLDDDWITDAEAAAVSDSAIIALVQEDLPSFCDGAAFIVTREGE